MPYSNSKFNLLLYLDSSKTTMQLPLPACNILISLFGVIDLMHLVLLLSCLVLDILTYRTWTCQTNQKYRPLPGDRSRSSSQNATPYYKIRQ